MMKRFLIISTIIFSIVFLGSTKVFSQADTLIQICTQHLTPPFISDGQQYKALLNGDEIAEFHTTFYGGSTYRIVGCSGLSDGNLVFNIYDKERNLLFTNREHENSPYWDFKFVSTIDCIIEAELDSKNLASGFALMFIGFKQ